MCVVERRIYTHANGRQDVVEKARRCHNATGNSLCQYVEHRNVEVARVVEMRPPSPSRRTAPSETLVTNDNSGRTRHYRTLARQTSKRKSTRRASQTIDHSPVDSVSSPTSPLQPTYRELRPTTPTPPPPAPESPSRLRQDHPRTIASTTPSDLPCTVRPDGTAVYSWPPSLEMPRAHTTERSSGSGRRASVSSTHAEVASSEPSYRPRPAIKVTNMGDSSSSGQPSSTGLSTIPTVSSILRTTAATAGNNDDVPSRHRDSGKNRARADSTRSADLDYPAVDPPRREEPQPTTSRRHRRNSHSHPHAVVMKQQQPHPRALELERKAAAEHVQLERERAAAASRRRNISHLHPSAAPPQPQLQQQPRLSARVITTTTTTPRVSGAPVVHHYRPEATLLERGEAVIAQSRAAVRRYRVEDGIARLELGADDEEWEEEDYTRRRLTDRERERRLRARDF